MPEAPSDGDAFLKIMLMVSTILLKLFSIILKDGLKFKDEKFKVYAMLCSLRLHATSAPLKMKSFQDLSSRTSRNSSSTRRPI